MDEQYPPPAGSGGGGGTKGRTSRIGWMRINVVALDTCLRRLPMGQHLERMYGVDSGIEMRRRRRRRHTHDVGRLSVQIVKGWW